MTTSTLDWNNFFSFLCLYVEDELVSFYVNQKLVNQYYVEQFNKIKQVDDPSNIVLAMSDVNFKTLIDFIQPYDKESLAKIELVVYTQDEMFEKHSDCFELD